MAFGEKREARSESRVQRDSARSARVAPTTRGVAPDLWDDAGEHDGGFLGITRLTVSKPTIASVAGHCVAGGLELALWCDLRVAGEDAVFGCFERRWGVPLVDGGNQRLPLVVGLPRARCPLD